jgi:hypothetical protein
LARTLVLVGLAAAVEGPLMWVLHHLPLFNTFRPYGRFSLWAMLGLVILARPRGRRHPRGSALVALS